MTEKALGADAPYEVLAPLAGGTYGENLVAVRKDRLGVGKLVVLRQLRRSLSSDRGAAQAFVEMGKRAVRLSHPNVVTTFELTERGGTLAAVTEYSEGEPLDAIMAAVVSAPSAVDPRLWLLLIYEALAGLHYAHELDDFDGSPLELVHGGLTPRRIFASYTGRVFLTDFGLATLAPHAKRIEGTYLPEMVGYASPEQRSGLETDRRSDIFSIGVILWELLSGKRHHAPADLETDMEPLPNLKELKEGIEPTLAAAVARAVALNPSARWATAAEFKRALEPHVDLGLLRRGAIGESVAALFAKSRDKIPSLLARRLEPLGKQGPLSLALRPSAPPGATEDAEEEAFLLASPIEPVSEAQVISVRELVSESELLEGAGAGGSADAAPPVLSSVELVVDFGSGQLPEPGDGARAPVPVESAPVMTERSPRASLSADPGAQVSVAPPTEVTPRVAEEPAEEGARPTLTEAAPASASASEALASTPKPKAAEAKGSVPPKAEPKTAPPSDKGSGPGKNEPDKA